MAEEQREDQLVQKILEFVGISQATEGEALEYLQRHRNDLEGAVAAYFNDKEQRRRGPPPRGGGGGGGGGLTAHNARNTTSSSRGSSKPLPAARNNYSSGPPITVRLFLEHNMREWKRVDLVDVEHPTVEHEKGSIASLKELCGRLIVAETVTTDRLVHELRGKGKNKKAAAAVTAGGAPASLHKKKKNGGEKKREAQKSSDRRKMEREELPPPLSAVGPSSSTGLKNKEDEDDDDEGEEESGVKDWSRAHAPLITEFDVLKDSLPLDLCQYLQYLRKCRPRAQQCRFGQDATLYDVGVWASLNFGIPLHRMRFWAFVKRRNRTTRPAFPFELSKFTQPIQSLLQHKRSTVLNLFLEESTAPKVSHTQEYLTFATIEAAWQPSAVVPHPSGSNTKAHTPLFPVHNPEEDALIFFKYYDPSTETLTYICHLYVHLDQQIENVVPLLNEKMGFSDDLSLLLFEEINEVMIDPLSASDTFRKAELSNGDCITFQLCPSEGSTYRWALATDYYQYLLRWMRVSFRTAVAPYEEVCCLLIEKTATYEQILGQLATFLCLDMSDIHLLSLYEHNGPHGRPAPKAIAPDDTWVASRLLRPTGPQYQHSSSNLTLYFSFCEL